MNPRVYDAQEVRAHLRLLGRNGDVVLRAPMAKVSPAGGILKCNVDLQRDQILNVQLEVGEREPIPLKAQVLRTGRTGVFVAWYPPQEALHRRIEDELGAEADHIASGAVPQRLRFDQASNRPTDALNIRDRARQVSSLDLAARHKTVHVLDLSTIQQAMDNAVADALKQLQGALGDEERARLREESERNFEERVAALKAEKTGLEAKLDNLEEQLQTAALTLDEERRRVIESERFTVSDAGMVELEHRFERLIDRAGRTGRVGGEITEDIREVVRGLLDEERGRIADHARSAQSGTIDLLERKVDRLAQTLDETRDERDRARERAHALESAAGDGRANVMTAGMNDDDPMKSQKLALLEQLVKDNKQLRDYASQRSA